MLKRLTIQNYALIDSLDIEFPEGLIIITGETGAGKSILLGALSLLLGNKADNTVFSDQTKNCVVEAEFDEDLILRRIISPSGRSRSFLNDEPVSLARLTEISNNIIDIHAQHQHLLLSDSAFQLSVVDHFAGNGELLQKYTQAFHEHKAAEESLSALERDMAAASADAEYREYQFRQLSEAKLRDGELEELEEEQKLLANAEELKNTIFSTLSLLSPYETSITQNIKEASTLLSKGAKYVDCLEDLSERLASCRIELDDIESELNIQLENVVISPERLLEVDDRLSLIYSLFKKHGSNSIAELISIRDMLDRTLNDIGDMSERHEQLLERVAELDGVRQRLADELSQRRLAAVPELSSKLRDSIRELEMPYAEFRIELSTQERLTVSGKESLDFLFSANGAGKLGSISKVASGGELSRVMLALKALVAEYTSLPTMIFDEIDTGVSGRIADKMGRMIGEMADNMQIFAITHLPQIASKHGAHYLVFKEFNSNGVAKTGIRELSKEERVMEVARMLSGSSLTGAAIENAKELLKEN